MTHTYSSPDYWREAELETTPRAIALYASARGLILTKTLAEAISAICTTIEKGG